MISTSPATCHIVYLPESSLPMGREPWGLIGPIQDKDEAQRACEQLRARYPSNAFRLARLDFDASPALLADLAERQAFTQHRLAQLLR